MRRPNFKCYLKYAKLSQKTQKNFHFFFVLTGQNLEIWVSFKNAQTK